MSEDKLTIPSQEQDLYTAYELLQMKPLIDKDNILPVIRVVQFMGTFTSW